MNPQLHMEFVALRNGFFARELTEEEWALLQVHLAYCDECREAFEQSEGCEKAPTDAGAPNRPEELDS